MKTNFYSTLITLSLSLFSLIPKCTKGQCTINSLTNSSFEDPQQTTNGDHQLDSTTFNGWKILGSGRVNIIKTNGSLYRGGPDSAQNGNQYFDITKLAGSPSSLGQNFTLTCPSSLNFSGYFSSREQNNPNIKYTNWTAKIDIVNSSNIVVASSTSRDFTIADGAEDQLWYQVSGSASSLPAGTYTFKVNLGDFGNFDNAFLCTECNTLPIKLISFTGEIHNGLSILNWKSASEINFKEYAIEYSSTGNDFKKVGSIETFPLNSNNVKEYSFQHKPANRTAYYRLKMVDKDGSYTFSKIVVLKINNEPSFFISPNPAATFTTIYFKSSIKSAEISVFDREGKKVLIDRFDASARTNYKLQTNKLLSGFYIIRLNTNDGNYSERLIISR